jgi:hypothetical protein
MRIILLEPRQSLRAALPWELRRLGAEVIPCADLDEAVVSVADADVAIVDSLAGDVRLGSDLGRPCVIRLRDASPAELLAACEKAIEEVEEDLRLNANAIVPEPFCACGRRESECDGSRLGCVNLSRAERAPATEELFADGPHLATSQFELGDPDLTKEAAWGAEAYVRATLGGADLRLAVFQNWFDNFIYLSETGEEEDELPVFQYLQQDADWFGVEAEASFPLGRLGSGTLVTDLRGSYIRATLDDGSPVPRIPPLTLFGALEWQGETIDLRAELERFEAQNRVSPEEAATNGFTQVNLSASIRPFGNDRVSLLLQADNLFDVEGRRHANYTKEFVPLAGRNFRISLRTRI